MESGPRKATEVLLDMESKIEILLSLVRTQDLNVKILTNKLNAVNEKLEKLSLTTPPSIKIEAVDTISIPAENKPVQVSPDNSITMEKEPKGFRRTSRPETYAGDDAYRNNVPTNQGANAPAKYPMQLPKQFEPEVVVPQQALKPLEVKSTKVEKSSKESATNNISVIQRIVDKNGKSVFLADVEIMTLEDKQTVVKTRTNGAGKWMASLPMGEYKIFIKKKEALNKDKMEVIQEIRVDGTKSQVELPTAIIKI
jgi:hypothetical protein